MRHTHDRLSVLYVVISALLCIAADADDAPYPITLHASRNLLFRLTPAVQYRRSRLFSMTCRTSLLIFAQAARAWNGRCQPLG